MLLNFITFNEKAVMCKDKLYRDKIKLCIFLCCPLVLHTTLVRCWLIIS